MPFQISLVRHPDYCNDYFKWRATYEGGDLFRNYFLKPFTKRETPDQFRDRKAITYVPAFAKLNVNRYKNMLFNRMSEVNRVGGGQDYQDAVNGKEGGVDLYGSSMNTFMAENIVPEMLVMRKVGIWVDRPPLADPLLSRNRKNVPYLYYYTAENILSWDCTYDDGAYNFVSVVLRDNVYTYEDNIITGTEERIRHVWLGKEDGLVHIQFWRPGTKTKDNEEVKDTKIGDEIVLDLPAIPFVVPALHSSIVEETSEYQAALMAIESSDINYILKGNVPFYTEQTDPYSNNPYQGKKLPSIPGLPDVGSFDGDFASGVTPDPSPNKSEEIEIGAVAGRTYPKDMERPAFIAPPTEPLLASMKKQEQLKTDINTLMDMAMANTIGQHASAQSKASDSQTIDSGLSFVGQELQYAEMQIAKFWGAYMAAEPASIKYPVKYELKSDGERIEQATKLNAIKMAAPSRTGTKEIGKQIIRNLLKDKVPDDVYDKVMREIDEANYATSDPIVVQLASEAGLAGCVTMSNSLGYDGKTEVPKAQEEHAERLARISKAQTPPGGVADVQPVQGNNQRLSEEKKSGKETDKKAKREVKGNR